MARALFFLALALLATAVYSEFIYTDDQLDEINDRLAVCLNVVPHESDFVSPSDTCRFAGINKMYEGVTKEKILPTIVECLHEMNAKNITLAQACLGPALAKPL